MVTSDHLAKLLKKKLLDELLLLIESKAKWEYFRGK